MEDAMEVSKNKGKELEERLKEKQKTNDEI